MGRAGPYKVATTSARRGVVTMSRRQMPRQESVLRSTSRRSMRQRAHDVECYGDHEQYDDGDKASSQGRIGVQQAEKVCDDRGRAKYGKVDWPSRY